ncbi:MAG: hypothetical protein K9M44_00125 [Candidatus Pacebacteria bacterium]|nr:hypothetical protein [Candidatus Paceibacterota bacterium]
MVNSKRNLKDDIKNGSSLLEIVGENIDVHVELYHGLYYKNKNRTRKEIIKIVIDDLDDELKRL